MVRIPGASDIEQVPAGTVRAPSVRASSDDFGAGAAEALTGLAKTGLDLAAGLANKRQAAEDETFVTAGMAEGRQLFADRFVESKDEAGDGAEFASSFDGKLDDSIPLFIDKLRNEGGHRPSKEAVKDLTGRLRGLKAGYGVEAARHEHLTRSHRQAASLDASMRLFATASSNNPEWFHDIMADAEDALERAAAHLPADELEARVVASRRDIATNAVGGLIARDPSQAVERLKGGDYDEWLDGESKTELLAGPGRR